MGVKATVLPDLYAQSRPAVGTRPLAPRPSEQIVRHIEEQIRGGRLVRGQKLPTEHEMTALFGVGRGVVREAVKMLDAMGLVESRRGSGIYVRNNPIASISRAFTFSVTPEEESVVRLFEFRAMLEADAAHAAARHRSEAQREAMAAWAEASLRDTRAGDVEAFSRANDAFHAAIREAAGNPYLSVALVTVREMLQDVSRLIARVHGSMPAAVQHQAIAAAIARHDADEAAALMRAHVHYTARRLQNARDHAQAGDDATHAIGDDIPPAQDRDEDDGYSARIPTHGRAT